MELRISDYEQGSIFCEFVGFDAEMDFHAMLADFKGAAGPDKKFKGDPPKGWIVNANKKQVLTDWAETTDWFTGVVEGETIADDATADFGFGEDTIGGADDFNDFVPIEETPEMAFVQLVIGTDPEKRAVILKDIYRVAAKHHHPDRGGDNDKMASLTISYKALTGGL